MLRARFQQTRKNIDSSMLERPSLYQQFDIAFQKPLVIVTAGSGYGKTHCVSSYLEHIGALKVWIQISELENLPVKFWETFLSALESSGLTSKRLKHSTFPYTTDRFDSIIHKLTNIIYQKSRVFIVFDDIHRIQNEDVKYFIDNLIMANIENLYIILISRFDLIFQYPEFPDKTRTARITTHDLRFSLEETQKFFKQNNRNLSAKEIENIQVSTEGWPLATQLINAYLKKNDWLFENPIHVSLSLIFHLIDNEIFRGYKEEDRNFFIKLSALHLDDIPNSMIRKLAANNYVHIFDLIRKNMFILLDTEKDSYHFHYMLQKFLRQVPAQIDDDEYKEFYGTVGDWYHEHNLKIDAITYFEKAEAYRKIWRIIDNYGSEPRPAEVVTLFIRLINSFPKELLKEDKRIIVTLGHLFIHQRKIKKAVNLMIHYKNIIESCPPSEENDRILGEIYLVLGIASRLSQTYDFVYYYKKAASYLPNGSSIFRSDTRTVDMGYAFRLHDYEKGSLSTMLNAIFEGAPHGTLAMNFAGQGVEYLAAAEAYYFTGNFIYAERLAYQAISSAKSRGQYDIVCNAHFILFRLYVCQGDYATIKKLGEQLDNYLRQFEGLSSYKMPEVIGGWFNMRMGKPEKAASWIKDNTHYKHPVLSIQSPADRVMISKAFYLLCTKQFHKLLAHLMITEKQYQEHDSTFLLLQVKIYKIICYFELQDYKKAIDFLQEAYDMSNKNHIIMYFVENGDGLLPVLKYAVTSEQHGIPITWIQDISQKSLEYQRNLEVVAEAYERDEQLDQSDVSLTDEEVVLLRNICHGMSREEIADYFETSEMEIRRKLASIYATLGAVNSIDAVRIATGLGLI